MPKYDSTTKCIEIYQCSNIIKMALERTSCVNSPQRGNSITGP